MGVLQGDLIQLTDRQSLYGQTILNVYYYRYIVVAPASSAIYPAFVTEWMDNVLAAILAIQHPILNHNLIEVRNLSNGIDIYQLPIDEDGSAVSPGDDTLPSYASVGFQLNRESLVTRNGYKRFAGIPEDHTNGNTWNLYGGPQSDELETQLAATQFISAVETFEPVIPKRPLVVPVGDSYLYASIGSASAKQFLGTQNTRKAGYGI